MKSDSAQDVTNVYAVLPGQLHPKISKAERTQRDIP
jgi:hypothetical protein